MKSKAIKTYVHYIICLVIIFGFGQLPPLGPLTPFGMTIAGIFLGVVYGWSFTEMIIPSLFGIIAIGFLVEGNTFSSVVITGFGNPIVWFLIFLLMFTNVVDEKGLTKYFAGKILSMKILEGKPFLLTATFFVVAYLLGAVNSFAAMFILWGILYNICSIVGYKPYDKYPTMMIIGITLFAILGAIVFPFQINPVGVLAAFENMTGKNVLFMPYILLMLCVSLLCVPIVVLLFKFIFRVDMSAIKNVDVKSVISNEKMVLEQKIVCGALVLLIILLVAPSFAPKEWVITQILNGLGVFGTTLLVVLPLMIVRIKGKSILEFDKMISQGIPWGAVFVTAFILPISPYLTDKTTGMQDLFLGLVNKFSFLPPILFLMLTFFIATFITNFANNVATTIIILPVVLNISANIGFPAEASVTLLLACAHLAILTAAACPMASVMFANTGWIRSSDIYRYTPLIILSCFLTIFVGGYFVGGLLF